MGIRTWLNATLTSRRMMKGAIVLLFSGMHFAACIAVGGFIAHQHENPDPETEARLYAILNVLELPIAGPLINTIRLDGLIYYPAYGVNSLLWGLAAYLMCSVVFAGLRRLWLGIVGPKKTSA